MSILYRHHAAAGQVRVPDVGWEAARGRAEADGGETAGGAPAEGARERAAPDPGDDEGDAGCGAAADEGDVRGHPGRAGRGDEVDVRAGAGSVRSCVGTGKPSSPSGGGREQ